MSELLAIPDSDYVGLPAEADMQNYVGATLAAAYPGYHWRVEAFPHPTKPFFDFRPEEIGAVLIVDQQVGDVTVQQVKDAQLGYTVKPWQFYSASSLKAEIIRGGGACLEVFELSRRRLNPAEWLTRPRFAGLLILPSGVV